MKNATAPGIRDVLVSSFISAAPREAARALEGFPAQTISEVLAELTPESAALVLGALSPSVSRAVLCCMEPELAAKCAENLSVSWIVAVSRGCPTLDAMIAALPSESRTAVRRAARQSVGLAASLLEPASLVLAADVKASRALDSVKEAPSSERGFVYVVEREGRLVGVVDPLDLIDAEAAANLGDLVKPSTVVREDSLLSELLEHPGWGESRALPVVDPGGKLRGVVRFESVRGAMLKSPESSSAAVSVPVSLAELFWLGLTGMTDGLARSVTRQGDDHDDKR